MRLRQSKTFLMLIVHQFLDLRLCLVIQIGDGPTRVDLTNTDLWLVTENCLPPALLDFLQVDLWQV